MDGRFPCPGIVSVQAKQPPADAPAQIAAGQVRGDASLFRSATSAFWSLQAGHALIQVLLEKDDMQAYCTEAYGLQDRGSLVTLVQTGF